MEASRTSSPSLNPKESSTCEVFKPDLKGKFDLQKLAISLLNGDYTSDPEYAHECWGIYIEEIQVSKIAEAKTPICVLNKGIHNTLLMQNQTISVTDWEPLHLALHESQLALHERMEIISGFDFVNVSFTKESWASFCKTFSTYSVASTDNNPEGSLCITFNGCSFEPHMAEAFEDLIGNVNDLSFKHQEITREQAHTIKTFLPNAKQLSYFSLNAVTFEKSAFRELLDGIQADSPLKFLKLSRMQLDSEQVNELTSCLKRALNITSLHITNDSLTSAAAKELAKGLVEQRNFLEQKSSKGKEHEDSPKASNGVLRLYLEDNTELDIEGAAAILQSATNLEYLSLIGCTESIKLLLPVVGTSIKEVNLGCLSINVSDAPYLTALFADRLEEASSYLPAHMNAEFLEKVKTKEEKISCVMEISEEIGGSVGVSLLEWAIEVNLRIVSEEGLEEVDEDETEIITMGSLRNSGGLQAAYLAAYLQQNVQRNSEELEYEKKLIALSELKTAKAYITNAINDPHLLNAIFFCAEESIKSQLLCYFRMEHPSIQTAWDLNDVFAFEQENMQNQALISYINANHFSVEDVPDDGNCLFWAVLQGLHKLGLSLHVNSVQEVREKIVAHMRQFGLLKEQMGDDFENTCKEISKDKTWSGDIELRALAETISEELQVNCSIRLFKSDDIKKTKKISPSGTYKIEKVNGREKIEINILYTNDPRHYMLLTPKKSDEQFSPAAPADFSWLQPPQPEVPVSSSSSSSSNISMDPVYALSIAQAFKLTEPESPPKPELKRKEVENPTSSHRPPVARRLDFGDPSPTPSRLPGFEDDF